MGRMGEAIDAGRTRKGERTKERLVECALAMFRREGYNGTTMRAIADDAGVSPGNAYYYFKSKDHLIQAYYDESVASHAAASEVVLAGEKDLKKRLLGVLRATIETNMPYHRFAAQLFSKAADPASPLSPFSDEQAEIRGKSIALYERVLEGSSTKITGKLREELPELLWGYQMGVILYWVHDRSRDCAKTYRMIDHTVDLVVRLIKLSRLPPMRPVVKRALQLMADLKPI